MKTMSNTSRQIGSALPVFGDYGFSGRVVRAEQIDEVLALLEEDLSGAILVTEQASASAFAPMLPRLAGVICTKGGESAHLAIVSRALALPCVMQAELSEDLPAGAAVRVTGEGSVWA